MRDSFNNIIRKAHLVAMAKYMFRSGMINSSTLNKLLKQIEITSA